MVHFPLSRFVTPLGESLSRRHTTDMIVENETGAQKGAWTEEVNVTDKRAHKKEGTSLDQ